MFFLETNLQNWLIIQIFMAIVDVDLQDYGYWSAAFMDVDLQYYGHWSAVLSALICSIMDDNPQYHEC